MEGSNEKKKKKKKKKKNGEATERIGSRVKCGMWGNPVGLSICDSPMETVFSKRVGPS